MKLSPDEIVAGISNLTTFPAVALRIDRALTDEHFTVDHIGQILETDPALSISLLKIANSAYFSRGVAVDSVSRAASVIGSKKIRDIVFTQCAAKTFRAFPNDLQSLDDFWNHSLYCAVAAQLIATKVRYSGGLSLYTAGLLHDIGQLVMFTQYPDESRRALEISIDQSDGASPHLGEVEVFGFDHTAVGAALARQWNLPPALSECIEFHHAPQQCSREVAVEIAIVHVANATAVLAELSSDQIEEAPEIDSAACATLGLTAETIVEIAAQARAEVDEMVGVFN